MKAQIHSCALIALALAACSEAQRSAPPADANREQPAAAAIAEPDAAPPASADQLTDADMAGLAGAMPVPPNPDPPIPRLYHGRWGLVPADCTSTAGDAKGLIIVDGETIRFYESLATAQEELVGAEGSHTGRFAVSGEGQSWQATLRFTRSGDTLTRTQDGSSFNYTRCL